MKTYLIIDEAQNMTPNQVKGIITRAGKDTKIILLGDPNQIDRPYLDRENQRAELCGGIYERQFSLLADYAECRGMRTLGAGYGWSKKTVV